jgi:hypothetical protein
MQCYFDSGLRKTTKFNELPGWNGDDCGMELSGYSGLHTWGFTMVCSN